MGPLNAPLSPVQDAVSGCGDGIHGLDCVFGSRYDGDRDGILGLQVAQYVLNCMEVDLSSARGFFGQ